MKVKSNGSTKDLREKIKSVTIGQDGGAYLMYRMNNGTIRAFIPFSFDGSIKSWKTNNSNPLILTVATPFRFRASGSHEILSSDSSDLIIDNILKVENGFVVDMQLTGDIIGGILVIKNLLMIEIE